jgi:hypothetical protein
MQLFQETKRPDDNLPEMQRVQNIKEGLGNLPYMQECFLRKVGTNNDQ